MSEATATVQYPIFVYGTLRPGADRYPVVRPFVEEKGSFPATMQGYQMYRFGRFPGLVKRPQAPIAVRGEVLKLKPETYEECILRLDRYESNGWLFDRVIDYAQTSHFADPVPCWVYVAREDNLVVVESNIILENDWFESNRG